MNEAIEGSTHKKAGDEFESNSIIAVTGLFLNGSATQFNAEGRLQRSITLSGKAPSTSHSSADFAQFTAAFKLMHLPRSKAHFRNFLISSEDVDVDNILKAAKKDATPPFDLSTISLDEVPLQTSTTGATEFTSRNATLGDEKSMHQENGSEKIGGAEGPRLPTASRTIGFPSSVPAKSSPESHIEFVTWRHLEHILGVCAIPLVTPRLWEDPFKVEIPENMPGDVVPIALTCGDLSGHRICHSASFFAFEFLIETAKKLQRICSNYSDVKPVLDRIQVVCKGHLAWLCQAELTEEGVFAANYKVAGRIWWNIAASNTWMPDDSLTDTPFQIIKAAHYYAVFSEIDLAQTLVDRVQNGVLCSLAKFDPRHKLVWPHREEKGVNVFRLDDQVWIWTAIKAAHDTEPSLWRFPGRNKNTVIMANGQPVSETKFEDDAAIILTHSAFHDLWENTIASQRHHEHNQEATWENALRYALAVVVGSRNRSLNNKIPKDLVMDSIEVLLRSAGSNAFFPGELEVTTKKPVLFGTERDRDYYFHASFEIPYVLLTNSHRINSLCESSYPSKLAETEAYTRDSRVTHESNQQAMEVIELAIAQPKHQPQLESVQRPITVPTRQAGDSRMKKTLPFSNIIDTSSVVEIEEEWLFNYPTFFSKHIRPYIYSVVDAFYLKDWVKEGGVIDQAAKMHVSYRATGQDTLDLESKESQCPTSFIVDIPKKKYREKRQTRTLSFRETQGPMRKNNKELWDYLKLQRTEKGAKKRLIQLSSPNALTALLCFLATPDDLKEDLSQFFDRHFEYVQYFQDGPFLILNRWKTEIHLSFYALADADVMDKPGRAIPKRSTCIYAFPGNENLEIRRYAVGLIFDGDFFDRYWTCHYITNAPDTPRKELEGTLPQSVATKQHFQQRRYIEIFIVLSTLELILASSHKILDQVQNSDYASRAAQWENIEPILARLEEEISSTLNTISRWENRERDRGRGEQPHWSRNDERKYRKWLNIGNRSAAVRIAELRDLQNKIKLLEMFIEKNLNWSRESLTFRSNENIIAFTYVTVIFLPLGFAVSIFSMSDSPPGANLGSMVICSVVALALTVLLLLNARGLMEIASAVSGRANQYSTARMKTSLIVPKDRDESDPENSHIESGGLKKTPKLQTSSWHLWFWFSHLLVELPARRILRAFRAFPNAYMSQLTNSMQKIPEEGTGRQQGTQESCGSVPFPMDRHDELYISQTTGKTLWTRIARVMTGFVMLLLFLPVFVPFWLGRIILYNILDALRLMGGQSKEIFLEIIAILETNSVM
ncbi:hypothetical protein N0V93_008329 [Gnomoniopsis smithogilvyi]|uniref:Uncharacterized protein n=1 Tax=Gnomoniopsis smithogilvyi TaxID=1191159 RepID=A0A9W8YPU7_9PEZI|nr:hypothetical protein N0V93_008329 [Gnomoniopsis smithogilvyi]